VRSSTRNALTLLALLSAACAADPGDPLKVGSNAVQGGSVPDATSGGDNGSGTDGMPSSQDGDGRGDDVTASSEVGTGTSEMPTEDGESPADAELPPGADAASADAATVASCPTCPIELKYMTTTTDAVTADIRPHYEIFNNGSNPQDLTVLTVRYYYTADGSTQQAYACDYAQIGCGSIEATFTAITPPKTNADHYIELSFTAGSIPGHVHANQRLLVRRCSESVCRLEQGDRLPQRDARLGRGAAIAALEQGASAEWFDLGFFCGCVLGRWLPR